MYRIYLQIYSYIARSVFHTVFLSNPGFYTIQTVSPNQPLLSYTLEEIVRIRIKISGCYRICKRTYCTNNQYKADMRLAIFKSFVTVHV